MSSFVFYTRIIINKKKKKKKSNHPPSGVESTCERSVTPGGVCAPGAKEQHKHSQDYSVVKDQSTEITFSIKTQWNAVYVTSRLGCLGRPAGAHSPLLLYGTWPIAASCTGEIPSFSIDLFNSGRSNSVRLSLTLYRAVGYHQVHDSHERLLLASRVVELVKTSKMHIYTYHLLVTTFEYLHVVTLDSFFTCT